jgi:hypothetical protein
VELSLARRLHDLARRYAAVPANMVSTLVFREKRKSLNRTLRGFRQYSPISDSSSATGDARSAPAYGIGLNAALLQRGHLPGACEA